MIDDLGLLESGRRFGDLFRRRKDMPVSDFARALGKLVEDHIAAGLPATALILEMEKLYGPAAPPFDPARPADGAEVFVTLDDERPACTP